ncbi:MAG: transcriptional repressor [Nitrosomonas sp.]|nr:transcriptional repressor [Nitrosomonas sp.]
MRSTSTRLSILKVLEADSQRWIEGEAIFRELIARGTTISLATVYRALKDLDHRGVLLREWRVGASGGKAVYRLSSHDLQDRNDAIVCRQCGVSVPIDDSAPLHESLRKLAFEHGFVLTEQPMTIHMTCDRCAGASDKKALHEKNISPALRHSMPLLPARRQKNKASDVTWPIECE